MDRFDAVVAAAVGGLSGQEMGEASIAKAAVNIATLVEHELAHLKVQQAEIARREPAIPSTTTFDVALDRHRREVDADALADFKDDEER